MVPKAFLPRGTSWDQVRSLLKHFLSWKPEVLVGSGRPHQSGCLARCLCPQQESRDILGAGGLVPVPHPLAQEDEEGSPPPPQPRSPHRQTPGTALSLHGNGNRAAGSAQTRLGTSVSSDRDPQRDPRCVTGAEHWGRRSLRPATCPVTLVPQSPPLRTLVRPLIWEPHFQGPCVNSLVSKDLSCFPGGPRWGPALACSLVAMETREPWMPNPAAEKTPPLRQKQVAS